MAMMQMISSGVLTMMRGDLAEIMSEMKEDLCIVYFKLRIRESTGCGCKNFAI